MNKHGFTLVEILVVIAIVGILLSIASPLASMVERYRFKSTVQEVYGDLLLARANSTLLNKQYSFVQDNTGTGYKIEAADHNVLRERSFSNVFISSSPPSFAFHSAERLNPLTPVEITLSNGSSQHYAIKISTIGHIRVERGGA